MTPQVVLLRLAKEFNSHYVNRTRASLVQHNNNNNSASFCEAQAIHGKSFWTNHQIPLTGLKFHDMGPGQIGCFLTHLAVWRMGLQQKQPVISLEADAMAVQPWTNFPSKQILQDYDVLEVFNLPGKRGGHCPKSKESSPVFPGTKYGWGTGAILFTNSHPQKVLKLLQDELVDPNTAPNTLPIDHWLIQMANQRKLSIGYVCYAPFDVVSDHDSETYMAPKAYEEFVEKNQQQAVKKQDDNEAPKAYDDFVKQNQQQAVNEKDDNKSTNGQQQVQENDTEHDEEQPLNEPRLPQQNNIRQKELVLPITTKFLLEEAQQVQFIGKGDWIVFFSAPLFLLVLLLWKVARCLQRRKYKRINITFRK